MNSLSLASQPRILIRINYPNKASWPRQTVPITPICYTFSAGRG